MYAEEVNQFRIGLARLDITPPIGCTMVGYSPRASNGIGHRLYAEAMCVLPAEGKDGWILITSDAIGYRAAYVAEVRKRISQATGIRPEAIMISGTHTHSGPGTILFGSEKLSDLDAEYLNHLADLLVELAGKAAEEAANSQSSHFEVAWTEAPHLASNRRIRSPQGKWMNEWQDPQHVHPGYFDPTIMLLAVRRMEGETDDALLVNYGVHPVVLGPGSMKISSDWPGYMKDMIEAVTGVGMAVFAAGGGANINPLICVSQGAELPRKMGESVAEVVIEATKKLYPVSGDVVTSHSEPWNIVRTRDASKHTDRPGSKKGDTIGTEIQVLRAGDLCIIGLPGELFSEYSRMIREASPLPHTMVVSLANDYIGYLPTNEAQTQGAYETNMAPAEPLEESLMEHASRALAGVMLEEKKAKK